MKNLIREGATLTVAAPYAVAAGEGVLVGQLFGVAFAAAENGADVEIATKGVFALAKPTGAIFTVGAPVYFNTGDQTVRSGNDDDSNSAGDNEALIGVAVEAAGSGVLTVKVLLGRSPVTLV